jgi:hypothetical protein
MSTATALITGGGFQDSEANALAGGTLELKLSHDAYTDDTNTVLICAGYTVSYILDINGSVPSGSTAWPNDLILDIWTGLADTYYEAKVITERGQLAWGPNAVKILSTPSPYDIGVEWTLSNPV